MKKRRSLEQNNHEWTKQTTMIINKRKQTDTSDMNLLRFEPAMKCYPMF